MFHVIGERKTEEVLSQNVLVKKHDVNPFVENVSTAIIEDEITTELDNFKKSFEEDAWESVLNLSNFSY